MNQNKSVVTFSIVTTLILFIASVANSFYHLHIAAIDNISIVSDILIDSVPKNLIVAVADTGTNNGAISSITPTESKERSIALYEIPRLITSFDEDTSQCALQGVMEKLYRIQKTKKGKLRIAWIGDSMIEGDLLTQTFRKRIQALLRSFGVGFIPGNSISANFRTTAIHKWSGTWNDESFKDKSNSHPLFLSGHFFTTDGGTLTVIDKTVSDSSQVVVKTLLCGYVPGTFSMSVNGIAKEFNAARPFNELLLDSSNKHGITIALPGGHFPVYGISMEPTDGVIVDNFSFRGITGLELNKLDTTFLKEVQEQHHYDLVILEYGANLMFRPNDEDYSWYEKNMMKTLAKFKAGMPGADFLVICTSDRAFKYGEYWQSAVGIHNLVKTQAELAFENKTAFFNMYQSMGGNGTIVAWADSTPSLANKDYVHPNHKGAEILGNMFFESFMHDYDKAVNTNLSKVPSQAVIRSGTLTDSPGIVQ